MKCVKCGQFGHLLNVCATEPSSRIGQDNGGIRSLKDIKDRCHIEFAGDCWQWRAAFSRGDGGRLGVPVAWSPKHRRVMSVLRMVLEFKGQTLARNQMVWRECRCDDCVNPACLNIGTRKDWGEWTRQSEILKGDPLASFRNRKARVDSGRAVLSMEIAAWIRESSQKGYELADMLGVSNTAISRVRTGKAWAATLPGASVFGPRSVFELGAV